MGKIIAIGGGEIGRPGYPVETTRIDKEVIRLSGKKKPRLLFIPTASDDAEGYVETVKKYFGRRLGCRIDVLYLWKVRPTRREMAGKIFGADIIYVGGGNTLKMMNRWRRLGVDKLLQQAYRKNIVLAGLSAGAICWFRYGLSDSRKFKNKKAGLIKVSGLGLIDALCCPHYDSEKARQAALKKLMKKTAGVAIALDNCAALGVIDGRYKILVSERKKRAYKIFWRQGKFCKEKIVAKTKPLPLVKLIK